jgi:hypothetical protein
MFPLTRMTSRKIALTLCLLAAITLTMGGGAYGVEAAGPSAEREWPCRPLGETTYWILVDKDFMGVALSPGFWQMSVGKIDLSLMQRLKLAPEGMIYPDLQNLSIGRSFIAITPQPSNRAKEGDLIIQTPDPQPTDKWHVHIDKWRVHVSDERCGTATVSRVE